MKDLLKKGILYKKDLVNHNYSDKKEFTREYKIVFKDEIKKEIEDFVNDDVNYKIKGSGGQTNPANVPWVSIYNKSITKSTQNGYYIAYLFHPDGEGVYLSLNQGVTNLSEKVKDKSYNIEQLAGSLSNRLRNKITLDFSEFNSNPINYGTQIDLTSTPKSYQYASVLYKYYKNIDDFTEEELQYDLNSLLMIYDQLVSKVDREYYDLMTTSLDDYIKAEEEENLRRQNFEDNTINKEENNIIALEEPPSEHKNKRKTTVSKGSFTSREIEDMDRENGKTGDKGELHAIKYFEHLIETQIKEDKRKLFKDTIDHVGKNQHGKGYDIQAFDIYNLEEPIINYYEVKTTKSKNKTAPYYLSLNEMLFLYENPGAAKILRIYDIEGKKRAYLVDPYEKKTNYSSLEEFINTNFDVEKVNYKILGPNKN